MVRSPRISFSDPADDAEQRTAKLRAAFAVFDLDGSGALSVDELRSVLARRGVGGRPPMSDDEIQALIDEFDEDGDGQMQFEEFVNLWGATNTTEEEEEEQNTERARRPSAESQDGGTSSRSGSFKSVRKRGSGLARSMTRRSKDLLAAGRAMIGGEKGSPDEFALLQDAMQLHQLALEQAAQAEKMRETVYDKEDEDLEFETRLGLAMINHPRALGSLASRGSQRLGFDDLVMIFGKTSDPKARGDELTKIDFRQAVRSPDKARAQIRSCRSLLAIPLARQAAVSPDTRLRLTLLAVQRGGQELGDRRNVQIV